MSMLSLSLTIKLHGQQDSVDQNGKQEELVEQIVAAGFNGQKSGTHQVKMRWVYGESQL